MDIIVNFDEQIEPGSNPTRKNKLPKYFVKNGVCLAFQSRAHYAIIGHISEKKLCVDGSGAGSVDFTLSYSQNNRMWSIDVCK